LRIGLFHSGMGPQSICFPASANKLEYDRSRRWDSAGASNDINSRESSLLCESCGYILVDTYGKGRFPQRPITLALIRQSRVR
jgi:hypothetical protein